MIIFYLLSLPRIDEWHRGRRRILSFMPLKRESVFLFKSPGNGFEHQNGFWRAERGLWFARKLNN